MFVQKCILALTLCAALAACSGPSTYQIPMSAKTYEALYQNDPLARPHTVTTQTPQASAPIAPMMGGTSEMVNAADDACGASRYASYVGGPVSALLTLPIPNDSRYYGAEETVDPRKVASRLNFMIDRPDIVRSLINPDTKVARVFCG